MDELVPRPALFRLLRARITVTVRGSSLGPALGATLVALPAIGLLLGGFLPQQDAYAGSHSFSLLAAFAAVGCARYLVAHIARRYGAFISACSVLAGLLSAASVFDGDGWGASSRRPHGSFSSSGPSPSSSYSPASAVG